MYRQAVGTASAEAVKWKQACEFGDIKNNSSSNNKNVTLVVKERSPSEFGGWRKEQVL